MLEYSLYWQNMATQGEANWNLGLLLAHSFGELTLSLCKVIFFLLVAFARLVRDLGVLAGPHLLALAHNVYEFHRTQMTWTDICAETIFVVLIVWFLVFRKRIAACTLNSVELSIAAVLLQKFTELASLNSSLGWEQLRFFLFLFVLILILILIVRFPLRPLPLPNIYF